MAKNITIIGGGLAGCFLAVLLAKRGYKVAIYERASKEEIFNDAAKRSVNLTFYGYGVQALKEARLWKTIEPHVRTLKGSITQVGQNAQPIVADLASQKMPYYTVSRSKLLQLLVKEAMLQAGVKIHFETMLISVNRKEKTMLVQDMKTKKRTTVATEVVLGTDGVNSQVRKSLQEGQATTHSQEYEKWTYKQVAISEDSAKKLDLQKSFMHAWTRENAVFTAFPNNDGSFAGMLIMPKNESMSFSSVTTPSEIKTFFTKNFPELLPALPEITESITTNPESHFITMSTYPWYYKDSMVILGDAAHAFLPFYGQGISTALGDCMEFVSLLDKYGPNWNEIFPRYQEARKKQTDVLGNLSKESFTRYTRTKRADASAIYDRLESLAHHLVPAIQPPLFMSVASDPIHAADHYKKHQKQRKIAKYLGVPVVVNVLTGIIALQETIKG